MKSDLITCISKVLILIKFSSQLLLVHNPQKHFSTCSFESLSEYEHDNVPDEGKITQKNAALRLALSRVASEVDRESMLSMKQFFGSRYAPTVSTGSLKLDIALGIGGLPKGRITEIYGREASGKTTLALHIIKEAQRLGGYCAYLDAENALNSSFVEAIGVNTRKLLVARPDSAENMLCMVDILTKSGSVDVVVVDSVAALVPQSELDNVMGGYEVQSQSLLMTKALRKIHSSLCRSQTMLIFVNQVRSRPCGDLRPGEEISCGGNALKFYAAVRMRMIRQGLLRTGEEVTGLSVSVQVVKNKLSTQMKKADLEIRFGKGIFCEAEVFDMACEHGVILKMDSGYFIEGVIIKDKREAISYLSRNHEILDKLAAMLRSQFFELNL
ncbi:hypothetical protein Syun_001964 [Stephania yunnanensis]|uniref:Uncharacterized protein n=1 Tax=Stephania yunnanensis TaxID=152371 RepID=A0AAP0Q8B5_9MAGN